MTPIGWVFLIVGPVLAVSRRRWLYAVTVFFLPFTATGVANIGTGEDASAVQISMYLGTFLIARFVFDWIRTAKVLWPRSERTALGWLAAFLVSTAVSLVMPVILNGAEQIPSKTLLDLSTTPLELTAHNVTGVLYILFGFLFAYCVAVFSRRRANMLLSIRSFMAGSIFAALWAVIEFICKFTGVTYPAAVFNTGTAASTLGYRQILGSGVFRLSSVAVEPSIFAQTLLIALCLYIPFMSRSRCLFGRRIDRAWIALLLVVLLCTTSSTAYLGILVLVAATTVSVPSKMRLRFLVAGTFTGLIAVAGYFTIPVFQSVFSAVLLNKNGSASALERLMTIQNSWEMFLRHPILGVGWESIASHDLVVHILANAGMVGFVCFAGAMFVILQRLHRSVRSKQLQSCQDIQVDSGIYLALVVTLVTSAVSGFLNVFGFFWFICGLGIAGGSMATESESMNRSGLLPEATA